MRIGELAAAAGTTAKTLRFYEEAGVLPAPARTAGGYRDYGVDALARLDFVRRSRRAGLTLAQVRQVLELRDQGATPCEHVQSLLAERLDAIDQQIADLLTLRETVAGVRADAATVDPGSCDPSRVCRYL